MRRAALNNGVKSYMEFFDGSQPADTDTLPTVTVERDGVVLAAPTVTHETSFGLGFYSITLTTAHTDTLGVLDITWSTRMNGLDVLRSTRLEVVGSRYFEIGELRKLTGMGTVNTHPDAALETALSEAEATIEDYTRYSFTSRAGSDVFDACEFHPTYGIHLRKQPITELVSISVDGAELTLTDWSVNRQGQVREKGNYGSYALHGSLGVDNLEIKYIYGDVLEDDLKKAALHLARHYALTDTSTIPDRSRLMQTEFGLFVLDNPGDRKATGIPMVDSILNRYCEVASGSFA